MHENIQTVIRKYKFFRIINNRLLTENLELIINLELL